MKVITSEEYSLRVVKRFELDNPKLKSHASL